MLLIITCLALVQSGILSASTVCCYLHIAAHANDRYQQYRLCSERMVSLIVEVFVTVIFKPLSRGWNGAGLRAG